jgi:periplasmic protein CpxP/Spy
MKRSKTLLLSGLAMLGLAGGAILPVVSLVASPAVAQEQAAPRSKNRPGKGMKELNLSEAQTQQMKQVRNEMRTAIMNVLTPAQKEQLKKIALQGDPQNLRKELQNISLSTAQKQQMQQIRQDTERKMMAILTPEQRAQLQQSRPGNR